MFVECAVKMCPGAKQLCHSKQVGCAFREEKLEHKGKVMVMVRDRSGLAERWR